MFEQPMEKAENDMLHLQGVMKVADKVASSNPTVSKPGALFEII